MHQSTAIIGGGAAGFFCAIQIKRLSPESNVTIYESKDRPLVKLGLTGGGRCNFTNTFAEVDDLKYIYPRGHRLMRSALRAFSPEETRKWWEQEGIPSFAQSDCRIFPKCQDASRMVSVLLHLAQDLGIRIQCGAKITDIIPQVGGYQLRLLDKAVHADKVVVCSGGGAVSCLNDLGLVIEPPVPSLFTLRIDDPAIRGLMGISVPQARLSMQGFRSTGALLFTDWGVSGPAVLKLSSYAARTLSESGYKATLQINYLGLDEEAARNLLQGRISSEFQRLVTNAVPDGIPSRLWEYLVRRAGVRADAKMSELGSKSLNRLVNILICDTYQVSGKGRFKDEFVTAGGVSLKEVDFKTLQSKRFPGLYFAGEVLDIDAVTGGFNLQAAWSTAYIAANSCTSCETCTEAACKG